jgi:hypothetical protein
MIKNFFIISLISLLFTACTERIDVELDTTYSRLVVDGVIETDPGKYRISLSESAGYFSNEPAPRVAGANVSIADGFATYVLHESGISGQYETDTGFHATPGKTYTLTVELDEPIAGQTIFEARCYLPPVTNLDSIATEFHPEWGPEGIWTIKLWAQEPGDEVNYYLFNLYRNGILLTDTISKKVVSDDMFYNGSYMTGVDVIYINNENPWETLTPGDTVMLQMSGISKEYYDFINQVRQSGFNIPFFSGPPANVTGNVSNGGIGFFAAYSNSYAKVVVE